MTVNLTTKQAATSIGITTGRMRQLLLQGRIKGAMKFGRDWMIPRDFKIVSTNKGPKPRVDVKP